MALCIVLECTRSGNNHAEHVVNQLRYKLESTVLNASVSANTQNRVDSAYIAPIALLML